MAGTQHRRAMSLPVPFSRHASLEPPRTRAVPRGPARRLLAEVCLYLSCSRHSRLRQREALAVLDDHLRRDVGLPARLPPAPLDLWLHQRLAGG